MRSPFLDLVFGTVFALTRKRKASRSKMCSSILTIARMIMKRMGNIAMNLLEIHIHSKTTNPNENNIGIIGNPSTSCGRVQPRKTVSNFILIISVVQINRYVLCFFEIERF